MQRILIGNIKGPQGAQGIQGPQGPVGATGPQGPMPDLVNNALATEAGIAALDAVMGKTLQDQITDLNSNLTTRVMYVGYYLNNQWITIHLKPNQTVLLTVNAFSQGNSVSNALYLICGASGADKSGSILKLGGTFDLITSWNTGLSISIKAAVDQWLQISALYL